MEKLGLPDLTTKQIETLCLTAEDAARKHILLKVPLRMVDKLNISVEVKGAKPMNITVEVDLALSPKTKGFNAEELANDAVKTAFEASEIYMRKLK